MDVCARSSTGSGRLSTWTHGRPARGSTRYRKPAAHQGRAFRGFWGLGFRIWGLGFRVQVLGVQGPSDLRLRAEALGFNQGLGFSSFMGAQLPGHLMGPSQILSHSNLEPEPLPDACLFAHRDRIQRPR